MKNFPPHLALAHSFAQRDEFMPDGAEHALVGELRRALSNPQSTSVGTLAGLVEQMLAELSVVRAEVRSLKTAELFPAGASAVTAGGLAVCNAEALRLAELYAALDGDEKFLLPM